MSEDENADKIDLPHHHQSEFCRTRPAYRQGRQLTAIKTYTINDESTHLLIFGVPKINLRQELKHLLQKYGKIKNLSATPIYPTEQFTECFHVNYERYHSARFAKKHIDMKNFYGGILHVCYAPELETLEETKEKIFQRKHFVIKQLEKYDKSLNMKSTNICNQINIIQNYPHQSQHFVKNTNNNSTLNLKSDIFHNCESVSDNTLNSNIQQSYNYSIKNNSNETISNKTSKRRYNNDITKNTKKKKVNPSDIPGSSKSFQTIETQNESSVNSSKDCGNVVIFDDIKKPKIVGIPRKATNKIIMKINTKLI